MKTPIILNLVWAGVAGAAFYTGIKWGGSHESNTAATAKIRTVMTTGSGAGVAGSKGVSALLVSKDDGVLDFYKRYGLDSGTPLSPEKMKEAMLEAIRESNPIKSQMLFARLMEELTPENATAALAMIRGNIAGMESMRYMGMLAYAWGEVDPLNAMKELSKGDDRGGRFSQSSVLTGWAAKDPEAAIKWMAAFEGDGREKEFMTRSLIDGLARSDVEGAMKYASTLKDEGERSRAAESIAREMIRSGGTEKATAWLNTLTDPDMKKGAFQTLADQILRGDSAKAAEFVKQYANEDFARGAIGNVAESIARKDIKQGLEFAQGLTGKAQASAIGQVVRQWMDQDKGANALEASKYVEALPAGSSRDAGARAIAFQVVREDPQAAIAWGASIQDPAQKQETLIDVGRRYMRQDPAAAAAWLAQSGLSAEAQEQVTNPRFDGGGPGGPGGGWDRFRGGPPGGGFSGGGAPTGGTQAGGTQAGGTPAGGTPPSRSFQGGGGRGRGRGR